MLGDVVKKERVTIVKAKDILKGVKKKNYDQKLAFEYASKFAKLTPKKAEKLYEELSEAGIPRIKRRHLVKLIDLLPGTPEEMRAVFAKEDLTLNKEDTEKILEILEGYR